MVVEIAQAELCEDVSPADFLAASQQRQEEFLNKQPGFVKHILCKGEGAKWSAVLFWQSSQHAQAAAAVAMQFPSVINFAVNFKPGSYAVQWLGVEKVYLASQANP
jgi:hypothetical protein